MHDILEGVLRVNLQYLMDYLKSIHRYSIAELNEDLAKFKYGRHDGADKVPSSLFTEKGSFTLSAKHMWTLMRIFPIMCGERFKDIKAFTHFVSLHQIFRIIYSDSFSESQIVDLGNKIEKYLDEFKEIYPEKLLTPKMHFLTHYPTSIRIFGPPRAYCTLRFESKHSYFKRVK